MTNNPHMISKKLCKEVKDRRKAHNLRQDDLAKVLNVNQAMVSRFEKGQAVFDEAWAPALKEVLGIDVEDYRINEEEYLKNKINAAVEAERKTSEVSLPASKGELLQFLKESNEELKVILKNQNFMIEQLRAHIELLNNAQSSINKVVLPIEPDAIGNNIKMMNKLKEILPGQSLDSILEKINHRLDVTPQVFLAALGFLSKSASQELSDDSSAKETQHGRRVVSQKR